MAAGRDSEEKRACMWYGCFAGRNALFIMEGIDWAGIRGDGKGEMQGDL